MHKSQDLGWRKESTAGTDAITGSGVGVYRFADYRGQAWGEYPVVTTNVNSRFYNTLTGKYTRLESAVGLPFAGIAINALPFLGVLGEDSTGVVNAADSGKYKHTLPAANQADYGDTMPSYTGRAISEDTDNATKWRQHYLYCVYTDLTFIYMDIGGGGMCTYAGVLLGQKPATPSFHPTTTYPGSQALPYRKDSNFVFTYDGTDMAAELSMLSLSIINEYHVHRDNVAGDEFFKSLQLSNRQIISNLLFHRGTDLSPIDDAISDVNNETLTRKDVVFQMYNQSDEYIKLTLNDQVPFKVPDQMKHTLPPFNNTWYGLPSMVTSLDLEAKDNLNDAQFWGAA